MSERLLAADTGLETGPVTKKPKETCSCESSAKQPGLLKTDAVVNLFFHYIIHT